METGNTESMLMELLTLVHGIKDEQANFAQQVKGIDTRLGHVETRLDGIEAQLKDVDLRLGHVEVQLEGMEKTLIATFDQTGQINEDTKATLHRRLDAQRNMIGRIEEDVEQLKSHQQL